MLYAIIGCAVMVLLGLFGFVYNMGQMVDAKPSPGFGMGVKPEAEQRFKTALWCAGFASASGFCLVLLLLFYFFGKG